MDQGRFVVSILAHANPKSRCAHLSYLDAVGMAENGSFSKIFPLAGLIWAGPHRNFRLRRAGRARENPARKSHEYGGPPVPYRQARLQEAPAGGVFRITEKEDSRRRRVLSETRVLRRSPGSACEWTQPPAASARPLRGAAGRAATLPSPPCYFSQCDSAKTLRLLALPPFPVALLPLCGAALWPSPGVLGLCSLTPFALRPVPGCLGIDSGPPASYDGSHSRPLQWSAAHCDPGHSSGAHCEPAGACCKMAAVGTRTAHPTLEGSCAPHSATPAHAPWTFSGMPCPPPCDPV
jgi:hypothetical protein